MIPLSPPCGGRGHGVTEGGSAASDQIVLEMGSPPSAFGISPARGAKGTYSKVSPKVSRKRDDARQALRPLSGRALDEDPAAAVGIDGAEVGEDELHLVLGQFHGDSAEVGPYRIVHDLLHAWLLGVPLEGRLLVGDLDWDSGQSD